MLLTKLRFAAQLSVKTENLRIRRELALAYRLIDKLQLNEGACNHLTAMAPAQSGQGQVMLVVPGSFFKISIHYQL